MVGKKQQQPAFDSFLLMQSLLHRMHEQGAAGDVVPKDLALSLNQISSHFHYGDQEDAHEFLIKLLQSLEGSRFDSAERRRVKTAALARCFGGSFCSLLTCPLCKYSSYAVEQCSPLQLNVGASERSLESALSLWGVQDTLGADNKWKCGGCNVDVHALKRMCIVEPPPSLVITLKRWGTRTGGMASGSLTRWMGRPYFQAAKITMHITFPLELDLAPVIFGATAGCSYDLTGVLVHKGSSPHDGHYIAYCKAPNGMWAKHDDDYVSQVKASEVLAASAYLLFYTRCPIENNSAASGASAHGTVPAAAESISSAAGAASASSSSSSSSSSSHNPTAGGGAAAAPPASGAGGGKPMSQANLVMAQSKAKEAARAAAVGGSTAPVLLASETITAAAPGPKLSYAGAAGPNAPPPPPLRQPPQWRRVAEVGPADLLGSAMAAPRVHLWIIPQPLPLRPFPCRNP